MGGTGPEHYENSSGKTHSGDEGGAESGALGARTAQFDPDLALIVAAWPKLTSAVKARIVSKVKRATQCGA